MSKAQTCWGLVKFTLEKYNNKDRCGRCLEQFGTMEITIWFCIANVFHFIFLSGLVFLVGSLRLVQHVESIQVPTSCEKLHLKTWKDVSWLVKKFEVCSSLILTSCRKIWVDSFNLLHFVLIRVLDSSPHKYRYANIC